MTDGYQDLPPTPSALFELKEERRVVQEGYDFLDEKRLLLVGEILRQLARYEALLDDYRHDLAEARQALSDAIALHGLEGVQVRPAATLEHAEVATEHRPFLGVTLQDAELQLGAEHEATTPLYASPEAATVAERFRGLLARATTLAAVSGNLHRLMADYRRTERRARALEDVLMPELDQAIAEMDSRLEELQREEAIRVRLNV
ncbi:MAG: ATPase [Gammaproteobacteria bacterium]|nr:ATPase [Gammaproteobacteria bacterium]